MKNTCFIFLISMLLIGCANTSGGNVPTIIPPPETEVPENPDESVQIPISLDNVRSLSMTAEPGKAGFDSIILTQKDASSDYDGFTTVINVENPDNTAVSVDFDAAERGMNQKTEAVKTSVAAAFKDSLYAAGLETISPDNIRVTVSNDFNAAFVQITGLLARTGFKFESATPTIEIQVLGDFTGYIDLTLVKGLSVEKESGVAGVQEIQLISSEVHEVSFTGDDIFVSRNRLDAIQRMLEKSFLPVLTDLKITSDLQVRVPAERPGNNTAYFEFTLTPPSGSSFATDENTGKLSETVTLTFTNEYGAFSGVLQVLQADVTVKTLKPDVSNAMVIGTTSWSIDGGSTPGGTRKIAVGEGTSVTVPSVVSSIAAKLEAAPDHEKYTYTSVGPYTKDELTNKVTFPVTFTSTKGYLFYNGEPTYTTAFDYTFQEGALTVNDKDFADTLEALTDADNIKALAGSTGKVTIEITENIKNSTSGAEQKPFTVSGGEEKLDLAFTATPGENVSVNGGNILTSLIVTGAKTTVTVGEGITINGGYTKDGGGGVRVTDGAHFVLNGGIIEGNIGTVASYTNGGGAVNVLHGTFTMNSGEIRNNYGNRGAGVFVGTDGTFIMNASAKIHSNSNIFANEDGSPLKGPDGQVITAASTGNGGGVYVLNGGVFTMTGGEIYNNRSGRYGSAITASVSSNTSGRLPTIHLEGGSIHSNVGSGAAILLNSGILKIPSGYKITDNSSRNTPAHPTADGWVTKIVDISGDPNNLANNVGLMVPSVDKVYIDEVLQPQIPVPAKETQ